MCMFQSNLFVRIKNNKLKSLKDFQKIKLTLSSCVCDCKHPTALARSRGIHGSLVDHQYMGDLDTSSVPVYNDQRTNYETAKKVVNVFFIAVVLRMTGLNTCIFQ